jgi:hypothetical protein
VGNVSSVPRVPSERLQNARTLVTLKRKDLPVSVVLGLLPVACARSQESLEMSGGHNEGQGEGHGAHLDRAGAADTMAPFNPVSNTLGTLKL